ncbi:MAG: pyruvate kinase [Candidatus Micrarchaeota archaeon]|nr:pyruvate kinase [Candidatus Micrarchaeota archaeon]
MRKTKIIATVGPSLEDYETMKKVFTHANIARFNFSHGTNQERERWLKMLREVEQDLNKPITALADTKGPEVRTQNSEPLPVEKGKEYPISYLQPAPLDAFLSVVEEGDIVLVDDGKVIFIYKDGKLKAYNSGIIKPRKSIIIRGKDYPLPSITPQDKEDIAFINKAGFDVIAQSFVRSPQDVKEMKSLTSLPVIAKIETATSLEHLPQIVEISDGVMVARGDLALSVPEEEMPLIQKKTIFLAKHYNKPVIVATQMLSSMVESPFPRRSEIMDIFTAVSHMADALMLSEETAIGKYPVEAVSVMSKVAQKAEQEHHFYRPPEADYKDKLAKSAIELAQTFNVPIVAPTGYGTTPKKLSRQHPTQPVYAITPNKSIIPYLNLFYAIYPVEMSYEPVFQNFERIKNHLNIDKALFVFGYPPNNQNTNTLIFI